MTSREWFGYVTLAIFSGQFVLNAASLAIGVYVAIRIFSFMNAAKDYLKLTKAYHDLVAAATARTEQIVVENAHATQARVAVVSEELKQAIQGNKS